MQDESSNANNCNVTGTLNWNLNQTDTFTVYDYSATTRQPDNAVTALDWLCVPIQSGWSLDGRSWAPTCQPTSISPSEMNSGITVLPNPTTDQLTISFQRSTTEKATISLFDMEGRCIKQFVVSSNQSSTTISLAELSSGVYFLKISDTNMAGTLKVLKN